MTECPTPKKRRYATVEAAVMAAARTAMSSGRPLNQYQCRCGWVHNTHLADPARYAVARPKTGAPGGAAEPEAAPQPATALALVRQIHSTRRLANRLVRALRACARYRAEIAALRRELAKAPAQ
ncbi:hypothetical protein [Streptomyces sp. NPDC059783]|uniref:hypothetical protein n=1 Tax=Streptomyces sp. NPDC059783 TaxID=3346944 RepID=UPI00364ABE16